MQYLKAWLVLIIGSDATAMTLSPALSNKAEHLYASTFIHLRGLYAF